MHTRVQVHMAFKNRGLNKRNWIPVWCLANIKTRDLTAQPGCMAQVIWREARPHFRKTLRKLHYVTFASPINFQKPSNHGVRVDGSEMSIQRRLIHCY